MKYKVHPKMIDSVAAIYTATGDKTSICLNSKTRAEIQITSGIRQGCTSSTSFFKLLTYIITKESESTNAGFKNLKFHLPVLLFANDSLLLANSIEEAQENFKTLIAISNERSLDMNKKKSNIIIYNMKEAPNNTEDIHWQNLWWYSIYLCCKTLLLDPS